jgi:hypothetical protein
MDKYGFILLFLVLGIGMLLKALKMKDGNAQEWVGTIGWILLMFALIGLFTDNQSNSCPDCEPRQCEYDKYGCR